MLQFEEAQAAFGSTFYWPIVAKKVPDKAKIVNTMIDAAQIRAARALLDISQSELSKLASVSATTVKRLEASPQIRGAAETIWKIQTALERAGVEFIPEDDHKGPGVRLKQLSRARPKRGRGKAP